MFSASTEALDARPRPVVVRDDVAVRPVRRQGALYAVAIAEPLKRLALDCGLYRVPERVVLSPVRSLLSWI